MELLSEPVEPTVKGMDDHGWSNSPAADHAPDDVHPEVNVDLTAKPGWTNGQAVTESTEPIAQPQNTTTTTARKTAQKKG